MWWLNSFIQHLVLITTASSLLPTEELRFSGSSRSEEKDTRSWTAPGVQRRRRCGRPVTISTICEESPPKSRYHFPFFLLFPFWSLGHVRECSLIGMWVWICQVSFLPLISHLIPLRLENILGVISILSNLPRLRDIPCVLERDVVWAVVGGVLHRRLPHLLGVQCGSSLLFPCDFGLVVLCNARKQYQVRLSNCLVGLSLICDF